MARRLKLTSPCTHHKPHTIAYTPLQHPTSLTVQCTHCHVQVEEIHDSLAHFGNGGMRPELAAALTLEGLVRYLMDRQQGNAWNEGKTDIEKVDLLHSSIHFIVFVRT